MSQSKTYSRRADAATAVDPDDLSGDSRRPGMRCSRSEPCGLLPAPGLEVVVELGVDEMTAVIDLVRAGPAIGRDPRSCRPGVPGSGRRP
ncbi:hypothetical protein [Mycolicibacterium fortuitum]|uniref:hypothetical protein n=1 Tax=Mycolicibacterium fortuitum TaxID=1766 RepID=UPI001CE15941|nr:hypothetical protein [Mycolicibacterium fortuitum]MCA4725325.1 hypothetical protein [Mycolicibacterium fortuitum]